LAFLTIGKGLPYIEEINQLVVELEELNAGEVRNLAKVSAQDFYEERKGVVVSSED
jgi:hypothetical protein